VRAAVDADERDPFKEDIKAKKKKKNGVTIVSLC